MSEKRCSKCAVVQPVSEFYRNKGTRDGLGSWCRWCERSRDRRDYSGSYRQTAGYDAARVKYQTSPKGVAARKAYDGSKRQRDPQKVVAREILWNAIKRGRIVPSTACFHCGDHTDGLEAHHEDYSKPLEVVWLCKRCHVYADRKAKR